MSPVSKSAALAALVLLTFLAYWPALGAGFIWDDGAYVSENPQIRTGQGLRRIWLDLGMLFGLTVVVLWLVGRTINWRQSEV